MPEAVRQAANHASEKIILLNDGGLKDPHGAGNSQAMRPSKIPHVKMDAAP